MKLQAPDMIYSYQLTSQVTGAVAMPLVALRFKNGVALQLLWTGVSLTLRQTTGWSNHLTLKKNYLQERDIINNTKYNNGLAVGVVLGVNRRDNE